MKTMSRLSAAERRQQNVGSRVSAAARGHGRACRRCDVASLRSAKVYFLVFTQFTKVVMNQSIMLLMLHAVSLDKLSIKIVLKEGRGSQLSDRHKPATVKIIDSV